MTPLTMKMLAQAVLVSLCVGLISATVVYPDEMELTTTLLNSAVPASNNSDIQDPPSNVYGGWCGSSYCRDGHTCCRGRYACCPLRRGVCCRDGRTCCPNGYYCTRTACVRRRNLDAPAVDSQP